MREDPGAGVDSLGSWLCCHRGAWRTSHHLRRRRRRRGTRSGIRHHDKGFRKKEHCRGEQQDKDEAPREVPRDTALLAGLLALLAHDLPPLVDSRTR